jgi:hypothetical protein
MQQHVHAEARRTYVSPLLPLQVWGQTFEAELGPLPPVIHGPCCAEFLVSRERIRARPRCLLWQ